MEAVAQGSVDLVLGRGRPIIRMPTPSLNISPRKRVRGQLCGSTEVDRLITRGRSETSPAARHAAYRQIEEIIAHAIILLLSSFSRADLSFCPTRSRGRLSIFRGHRRFDYASLAGNPRL